MINPEFKRNLWLSFNETKLITMPAFLALFFLAIYVSNPPQSFAKEAHIYAIALFAGIVWLWGSSNASASILDEFRNKTWDQQRMSALDPWSMTWGKLFGATAFNWYGGAICLSVIAVSGLAEGRVGLGTMLVSLCALAVMFHATMIVSNLYISQFGARPLQRASLGWVIVSIVAFKFFFDFVLSEGDFTFISWWGVEIDRPLFWLFTVLLFSACLVFAAWRAMCSALQVPTLPWAWPLFAVILTIYFAGLLSFEPNELPPVLMLTGLLVSIVLTYLALFAEANTLLRWHKLRLLQKNNDWRGWFEQLPVWTTTLVLSLCCAILVYLFAPIPPEWKGATEPHPLHAFVPVLMLLRDVCIVLFFALAKNNKIAAAKSLFYLLLLDLLLPYVTAVTENYQLLFWLLPFPFFPAMGTHTPGECVAVMGAHATVALALVILRLRATSTSS